MLDIYNFVSFFFFLSLIIISIISISNLEYI